MALTDKLTSIADAIRDKTGKTEEMTLDQMATEIASIETGGGEDYLAQRLTNTLTHYENNSITELASYSFRDCTPLVSIRCDNVSFIGGNAFYGAKNLETAIFPNLVNIDDGPNVFRGCSNLKEFVVHKLNSWRLDAEVFGDCKTITKIDLGRVERISGYGVFSGCSALNALVLRQTDSICELTVTTAFLNSAIANGTGYIYVPSALLETYKTATNWSVYADRFRAIEGSEYE